VRLDHLLSKEHLPAKVGKEPAPSDCGGGVLNGGDTGELFSGNGRLECVSASFRGCADNSKSWCGWWEVLNTLLGPERTSVACS
jgi:hypothetical protein